MRQTENQIADLGARQRRTFAARIRRLARYLRTIPRSQYDHGIYGSRNECGTSACAIGHAHLSGLFRGAGLRGKWVKSDFCDYDAGLTVYHVDGSPDVWDSVNIASDRVFGPGVDEAVFHNLSIRTPKEAARELEHFADRFYGKERS